MQPAAGNRAASAEDSPIERRITAALPNATIIASYGATDRAEVVKILTGGRATRPPAGGAWPARADAPYQSFVSGAKASTSFRTPSEPKSTVACSPVRPSTATTVPRP